MAAIRQLDKFLSKIIRERFEVLHRDKIDVSRPRNLNALDLVLRDRIEQIRKSGTNTSKSLERDFMAAVITQVKTLLLGGHGTISDTICFTFMLLSMNSTVVNRLREEHDRVFTSGIDATFQILQNDPHKVNNLEYTNNVLKETLRLYPIGSTARAADSIGSFIYNGRQYSTKGQM